MRYGIIARALDVRPARAETTDGAIDEPRIDLEQPLRSGAQARRGAGTEILDEDISLADQPLENQALVRGLQVECHAALVAIVGLEVRRIIPALVAAVGITVLAFDLYDVRTEIRQHHSSAGTGDERPLLHHPYAAEGSFDVLPFW